MCKNNVCILPIAISVLLGIVIGVLFYAGTITTDIIAVPILIATAFAAVSLILLYITAVFSNKKEIKECVCEYGKCLFLGGTITLIIGFIALIFTATIATGSILSAILIGAGAFGIVLNIISFFDLFVCLVKNNCYIKNDYC